MCCSVVKCSKVLQCSEVLRCSYGSFFFNHCLYGCMFYILLILTVMFIVIVIVMYALFCIFCFLRANWHSSATLTEVFPCFFLCCKANARVFLAMMGHGPHSS
jgi:uncharacterized membrane protein